MISFNLYKKVSMKKILIISLLMFGLAAYASYDVGLIKMPSADELSLRISRSTSDHFIEKTKLHTKLAGKSLEPEGVAVAVALAIEDYCDYLNNPMMARAMQKLRPHIILSILEGQPDAIAALKRTGLL